MILKMAMQIKIKNNLQKDNKRCQFKLKCKIMISTLMRNNIILYLSAAIDSNESRCLIFSIVRMLISFAVIAGIIYLIYYFFI